MVLQPFKFFIGIHWLNAIYFVLSEEVGGIPSVEFVSCVSK